MVVVWFWEVTRTNGALETCSSILILSISNSATEILTLTEIQDASSEWRYQVLKLWQACGLPLALSSKLPALPMESNPADVSPLSKL